jgi:hypothetical protein
MKKLNKGDEVSFVVRARIWNGTLLEVNNTNSL